LVGIAGAISCIGDHRRDQEIFILLGFVWILVRLDEVQDRRFYFFGNAVGFLNVSADWFLDEYIHILRVTHWEEYHLGREQSKEHKRKNQ
jgi:hypothetical protein